MDRWHVNVVIATVALVWGKYEYDIWRIKGIVFWCVVLLALLCFLLNILRRIHMIEVGDGLQGALVRLELFSKDAKTQIQGRRVVLELLSRKLAPCAPPVFKTFKGISILLQTSLMHSKVPRITELSLDIILRLKVENSLKLEKDHVVAIVQLMKTAVSQVEIQRLGCMVLGCAEMQHIVIESEGIKTICNAMREHKKVAKLQQWGCWALFNICKDSVEAKCIVLESKGLECVLFAMETFPKHNEIQKLGAMALYSSCLAVPETIRTRMIQIQGFRPILCHAMAEFPKDQEIQDLGRQLLRLL